MKRKSKKNIRFKKKYFSNKTLLIVICVSIGISAASTYWHRKLREKVSEVSGPSVLGVATFAQDTFQRDNISVGWGTASDGQGWGADGQTSNFTIDNQTGLYMANNASYNAILGPQVTDSEVMVTGKTSNFSNCSIGAIARFVDSANYYRALITGGSLVLTKKFHNATTNLQSVPFSASPNTLYTIDFQVNGTTLNANVWVSGTSEPSGWMISATDTTISGAGNCGVRLSVNSGQTITLTSFQCTQWVPPTPSPTPSATPTPTAVPKPTNTPTPTAIPIPLPRSTATPFPTAKPISSSTPTNTPVPSDNSSAPTIPAPITETPQVTPIPPQTQDNNPIQSALSFIQHINPFQGSSNKPAVQPPQTSILPGQQNLNPSQNPSKKDKLLYDEAKYSPNSVEFNFAHNPNSKTTNQSSFLSILFSINDGIKNFFTSLAHTLLNKK